MWAGGSARRGEGEVWQLLGRDQALGDVAGHSHRGEAAMMPAFLPPGLNGRGGHLCAVWSLFNYEGGTLAFLETRGTESQKPVTDYMVPVTREG